MKTLGNLLFIIGFIIFAIFLIKGAFLLHSYLGWITIGGFCVLIGGAISDNHS